MKKSVLLFLVSILFVSLVSAEYNCSGTTSSEESVIDVGTIEVINGVRVAVLDAGMSKSAEILIDARKLKLTNESSVVNVTLVDGYREINLTRIFNGVVSMKVKNVSGDARENEVVKIGSLQVYITSLTGTYPGDDADVEFFVGSNYSFLYEANPSDVQNVGTVKYMFGVSSASSSGAIIEVQKCSGGSFVEINETVEDIDNSSIEESDVGNLGGSLGVLNGSLAIISNGSENESGGDLQEKSPVQGIIVMIIVVTIIIIGGVIFFLYIKRKENDGASGSLEIFHKE